MARLRSFIVLTLLLLSTSLHAQLQTGNLFGKVQSKDGSALPGVTVTLTGVGAPQTYVTDATGAFRFLNLSPGTYAVKGELSGFGAVIRQGISISIARNADVSLTLNPAAAESITVTAEAPLLDTRRTGTGATVTKVELENVPTGRDPWVILQATPGVLMDRVNVGGSESGQQSTYAAKGVYGTQATWNVDGVNITDLSALGGSPAYYDFDSFDEMQVTTGSSDVRTQTAGVQLNMVTKRGTNDFKGSGRFFHTGASLQATPAIPSEATPYLAHTNQLDKVDDYGLELGGPIKHDRLWFWGAFADQKINALTAQNNDARSLAAGRFHDATELKNSNTKFNAQPLAFNSLALSWQRGDKIKFGRGVGPALEQAAAWDQDGPTTFYKIEDTNTFGSKLYLTGLFAHIKNEFSLFPDAGQRCTTFACSAAGPQTYLDQDFVQRANSLIYVTKRPSNEYRVDGSGFASAGGFDHELKFGFGYRKSTVSSISAYPHDTFNVIGPFTDLPGTPGAIGSAALFRPENITFDLKNSDAYVGDTMLRGNLTLEAGLRLDSQKSSFRSGSAQANAIAPDLFPGITWNGADVPRLSWNNVAPRLALTYALGADRHTLLRAAVNRYYDQIGGTLITSVAPASDTYQYLYTYFQDLNGDKQVQRNELCGSPGVDCTKLGFSNGLASVVGLDPSRLGSYVTTTRYASNLKNTHTDELILGFEREVLSDFSIGITGTYRKIHDIIGTVFEKTQGAGDYYTSADYQPAATPVTTTINGRTYTLPYYVLKPGVPTPFYQVLVDLPDYSQSYKGFDLTATRRLSNRWMMRGSFSFNDWRQQVGPNTFADPTHQRTVLVSCSDCNNGAVTQGVQNGAGSKGGVYINSKWQYNLTGTYQIPVVETSLGFNFTGHEGYPVPYAVKKVGSDGITRYLLIGSDVDSFRLQNFNELDLRLAKTLSLGPAGLTLSVDGFNVLNENTILQREVRAESSSRGRVKEVMAPRIFRIGARVTF